MKVRAAYDISFLAGFFDRPGEQSGVYRTVEELLFELDRRDDLELTAVSVCGRDPLFDAVNSSLYVAGRRDRLTCKFDPALAGRYGLSARYFRSVGKRAGATNGSTRPGRAGADLLSRVVRKLDRPRVDFDPRLYDVFHSPFLGLPPREALGGVARVLTVYDLIFLKNPEFMPPEMVAFLSRIFESLDTERDWVTCISEFTKQEFCEYTGMSPERVFVTPLAAADHFRPVGDPELISDVRRRYGIPEGDYLLALAALQPRKNFDQLIRCFLRLLTERPDLDANLVLVGKPSWMYDEIFSACGSSPELRARVAFTGFVPDEDLSAVYSGASGFLFPSLYEGFGLPPLEAMQCGVPVVASDTTALPEVVGDAGLLVNPKDADSLCQAMLDLLTDEGLRRDLGRRGLERAREFSWARCAEKTVEAYREAAGFA